MDAPLTGAVFGRSYLLGSNTFVNETGLTRYIGRAAMTGCDSFPLKPGETLQGEKLYLEIADTNNVHYAFANYFNALKKEHGCRYKKNPLVHSVSWDSFNMGIGHDVSEAFCLRVADYVTKKLPSVEWVQIDAEYCKGEKAGADFTGLDFAYPDADENVDKSKFPEGMRAVADKGTGLAAGTMGWADSLETVAPGQGSSGLDS